MLGAECGIVAIRFHAPLATIGSRKGLNNIWSMLRCIAGTGLWNCTSSKKSGL